MSAASKGILIAVDGIDGAGKTTQVRMLTEALQVAGETVVASKELTDGPWGRLVRESAQTGRLSLVDELNAFIEDRKEHVANKIKPALDRGEIVILDRYYYSTIAYQGARGADVAGLIYQMSLIAPKPDAAFLIDVDQNVAMHRISSSRGDIPNEFERADYLGIVRGIFRKLLMPGEPIQLIDGHGPQEAVFAAITHALIDGALKTKRCAKPYDCDIFYCSYRINGECRWVELQRDLRRLPAQQSN